LSFVALLAALLFGFSGDHFRVSGSVSQDRVWVNLKGVDEAFAAAITNALRPAPQAVAVAAVPHHATPSQAASYQAASYQAAPQQPSPNQAAPYQPSPYQATPDILPGR
jgi:hypothetical protein